MDQASRSRPTTPPLLIQSLPGRRTVCAGIWVCHGSAHDPPSLVGATHLVEHLTLRRCGDRSRQSLAATIDRLGGDVDAWTSAESMGVTVQTTVDAVGEALCLLRDAILEPTFDLEDVELERKVALAELDLINDDPGELVEDAILRAAWGEHPLARSVIGSRETLARLDPETLRQHHQRLVEPGRLLLAVAGDVDESVVEQVADLPLTSPVTAPPLPPLSWVGGHTSVVRRGLDQVHARLAFPALTSTDPSVTALSVLNRVLGVGASSRLFQRLREEEGLTYDIWSGLVLRTEGGLLEVGWTSAPDALDEVWRLVHYEISKLLDGIGEDEVAVAKEGVERCLVIDSETVSGRCSMDVGEALERGRRLDVDRLVTELREVTCDEVMSLAKKILRADSMASALCGPKRLARLEA